MGQSLGTTALPTARAILDRAIEAPNGVKIQFTTSAKAFSMRMQCYTCRSRERKRNTKIYDPDHFMYGNTPWDALELSLEGAKLVLTHTAPIDVEEF